MRVLMVSKALVVGAYQSKAEAIARHGIELYVLTPPSWRDRRGAQVLRPVHTQGYELRAIPMRLNGNFHLHHYPTLARELGRIRPDVLHMDEEPYNLATWLALRAASERTIAATFFTWQNIDRRYPFPFSRFEQDNYRVAPVAIAGNQDAAAVLRRKGYCGEIATIPQFGVDPSVFAPGARSVQHSSGGRLHIGFAGGLLPEKGIDDLLHACSCLRGDWRLTLAGEGSARPALAGLAEALGITSHVTFSGPIDSVAMPEFYRNIDVLVLPSHTTPTWKEQFGRVLIEAMACETAVVGSSSGEIPHVIGDAGLIFPERDRPALAACLQRLLDDSPFRIELGAAGRRRVLDAFTMDKVAAQTVAVYQLMAARRACE